MAAIACSAASAVTPHGAAAAAAKAALPTLTWPGIASSTRWRTPDGSITSLYSTRHVGVGRDNPQPSLRQPPWASRCRMSPHFGQAVESYVQRCPAETQVTFGDAEPAHATSGSSALATT